MKAALELHAAYPSNAAALAGKRATAPSWPTPDELPGHAGRFRLGDTSRTGCIHCHWVDAGLMKSSWLVGDAVTDDMLYLGDTKGDFYGIDALTGRELWRVHSGAAILASPLVLGQRVHFGNGDGVLHALDRFTGESEWKLDLGAPINIPPIYAHGRIYVHTSDGKLHAIE